MAKRSRSKKKALPTLEECERALGEPAEKWVARCYEISCAIVKAKLVQGQAVYGHWIGDVARGSFFYTRGQKLPFVQHGWILLDDERIMDPTRWVFEAKAPYLYVGEEPLDTFVVPCRHCEHIEDEHDNLGACTVCDCMLYEPEVWPYDEGGNRWREKFGRPAPVPAEGEKRFPFTLSREVAAYVKALLGESDGSGLTTQQILWLANLPYQRVAGVLGPSAIKEIYDAICSANDVFVAFIPIDNQVKATREAGFVVPPLSK